MVGDEVARRPDIRGLADYLRARDAISAVLAGRESHELTATANQDLAPVWQTIVARIIEQNPAFADLWYRRLESDPLDVSAAAPAAA